jgi:hypothetical protein
MQLALHPILSENPMPFLAEGGEIQTPRERISSRKRHAAGSIPGNEALRLSLLIFDSQFLSVTNYVTSIHLDVHAHLSDEAGADQS